MNRARTLRASLLTLIALAALAAVAAAPATAARSVPRGWLGVVGDGALTGSQAARFDGEFDRMAAAGVESVRAAFYWNEAQPYARAADVPPDQARLFRDVGGVPTDFGRLDALMTSAVRRRLQVVPVVHRTPGWAAADPGNFLSSPSGEQPYAAFLTALVGRYGPQGSFWRERPRLPRMPIRDWQVWNEPDLIRYWSIQPFAASYVRLLRSADSALKAADPRSRTILAGLPNRSFASLKLIYDAGGRGTFDAVALHPYTGKPRDVVQILELARREMRRRGDARLPLWVTEISWPAAAGKVKGTFGFETTERGQAARLRSAILRLAAARRRLRIERVFWYTWISTGTGQNSFEYSGLRRQREGRVVNVPSLAAYRSVARRLEGCVKARRNASRCR